MKKLAIYYGWPSCVNQKQQSLDDAVKEFSGFDAVIFGDALVDPSHGDHENFLYMVSKLNEEEVEAYGYIDLATQNTKNAPGLSEEVFRDSFEKWKEIGVYGILFDDLDTGHCPSIARIEKYSSMAHSYGLNVFFNNPPELWRPRFDNKLAYEPTDSILIEPLWLGHGIESNPPDISDRLKKFQSDGLQIYGVSTYDDTLAKKDKELKWWFEECKSLAEKMRLDGFGFTHMMYSCKDNVLPNFFETTLG